jgi:hypothetical protein
MAGGWPRYGRAVITRPGSPAMVALAAVTGLSAGLGAAGRRGRPICRAACALLIPLARTAYLFRWVNLAGRRARAFPGPGSLP